MAYDLVNQESRLELAVQVQVNDARTGRPVSAARVGIARAGQQPRDWQATGNSGSAECSIAHPVSAFGISRPDPEIDLQLDLSHYELHVRAAEHASMVVPISKVVVGDPQGFMLQITRRVAVRVRLEPQ